MAFDLGQLIRNIVSQFNQGNQNAGSRSGNYGHAGQSASRAVQGINASPNRPVSRGGSRGGSGGGARFYEGDTTQSTLSQSQPVLSYSPTPDYGYGMGGGKAEPAEKAMFDNPLLRAQNQNGGEQQGNNESENSYEYQRPDVETFTISKPIGGEQRMHDGTGRVSYTNTNKISEYTDNNTGERTTDITSRQVSGEQPNKQNRHPEMKAASMPIKDALSSYVASQQGNNMDKEAMAKNPGMIPDMTVLGIPYDNPNVRKFNQAMEGLGLNSGGMRALNQAGISPEELAMAGAVSAPALSLSSPEKAYADTGEEDNSSAETENNGQRIEGHASKNRTTGPSASAYSINSDALQEADERNIEAVKNLVSDGSAQRSVDDRGRPIDQAIVNNVTAIPPEILNPTVATWGNAYKAGDLTKEQYDELYWDFINSGGEPYIDNPEYGNQANANGSNKKAGGSSNEESSADNSGMSSEDYQNASTEGSTVIDPETGLPVEDSGLSETEAWAQYLSNHPELTGRYDNLLDFKINGTGEDWYDWVRDPLIAPHYSTVDQNWNLDQFLENWFNKNEAQYNINNLMENFALDPFYAAMGYDPELWRQFTEYTASLPNPISYARSLGLKLDESEDFDKLINAELAMAAYGALQDGDMHGLSLDDINSIWNPFGIEAGTGDGYTYTTGDDYLNVDPNLVSFGNWWDYQPAQDYLVQLTNEGYNWADENALAGQSTFDVNRAGDANMYRGTGLPTAQTGQLFNSLGLGWREI